MVDNKMIIFIIIIIMIIQGNECLWDRNIETYQQIRTFLTVSKTGKVYVAKIWLGTPRKEYNLKLDFSESQLILFNDKQRWPSQTTIEIDNKKTDIIEISNRVYRVNIVEDYSYNYESCKTCLGILGIGTASFVWKLWTMVSFTPSSIFLDSIHPLFYKTNRCHNIFIRCNIDQEKDFQSLCSSYVLLNDDKLKVNFSIDFGGRTFLPEDIYDDFTSGLNIYHSSLSDSTGRSLQLKFLQQKDRMMKDDKILGKMRWLEEQRICPSWTILEFRHVDFISQDIYGQKMVHISSTEKDEIILSIPYLLSKYVICYDNLSKTMVLTSSSSALDYSTPILIYLIPIFFLLIRIKNTNSKLIFVKPPDEELKPVESNLIETYYSIDIFFQFVSIIACIPILFLRHTLEIRDNFPLTYIYTVLLFFLAVAIQMILIGISFYLKWTDRWNDKQEVWKLECGLWNYFSLQFILLTALWFLLSETSLDQLANPFTFLAHIAIVYIIDYLIFYFILIHFLFYDQSHFVRPFAICVALLYLILGNYISWTIFFNNFLQRAATHLNLRVDALNSMIWILTFLLFLYLNRLYLLKAYIKESFHYLKKTKKKLLKIKWKTS